jgi:hypothetical protein
MRLFTQLFDGKTGELYCASSLISGVGKELSGSEISKMMRGSVAQTFRFLTASEPGSALTRLSGNINQPSFEKIDQFLRWPDPYVCVGLTIGIFHEYPKSMSV